MQARLTAGLVLAHFSSAQFFLPFFNFYLTLLSWSTMVKDPKVQEIIGTMQRPIPKLQWERTGLTAHCLSCHARNGKLSAGPPIAAFDLRRLKGGNTPRIRVTQQAESAVGSGRCRLKPFTILEACK